MSPKPLELNQWTDVFADLAVAYLEAGEATASACKLVEDTSRQVGAPVRVIGLGRAVMVERMSSDGTTYSTTRVARSLGSINCRMLTALQRATLAILHGSPGAPREAASLVRGAASSSQSWWWGVAGLMLLNFCIALQTGAGWLTSFYSSLVQGCVVLAGHSATRINASPLFVSALQSCVAVAVAAVLHWLGAVSVLQAVVCVGVSWLLIIPLPTLIGAMVDAVSTEYSAALTKLATTALSTAGVAFAAALTASLVPLSGLSAAPAITFPALALPLILVFSGLGAVGNAFANGGNFSLVIPAALIGLGTAAVNQALLAIHMEAGWANTLTAALLGLVGSLLARKYAIPGAVLALFGITGALLPGLDVLHGMLAQIFHGSGVRDYGSAALVLLGLSVGVAAGAHVATLITRPRPFFMAQATRG